MKHIYLKASFAHAFGVVLLAIIALGRAKAWWGLESDYSGELWSLGVLLLVQIMALVGVINARDKVKGLDELKASLVVVYLLWNFYLFYMGTTTIRGDYQELAVFGFRLATFVIVFAAAILFCFRFWAYYLEELDKEERLNKEREELKKQYEEYIKSKSKSKGEPLIEEGKWHVEPPPQEIPEKKRAVLEDVLAQFRTKPKDR